ncbi:YgcG family protein [Arcobacter sp. LA11]|uniref:TPM domain-containing protein n=1 Tax=Arcobacter sp. LA11 TaxID=1898176 RepID=UPI000933A112|nr:TPM domain-containing protein [Arcobacter sp. LA11]
MKKAFLLLLTFFAIALFAVPTFPELTGRVVDNAQILSVNEENNLTTILEKHENETSNQVVIVTLDSLDGYDIADYGYQLGRHWGIGQKDKNNGVLLIISMNEKKIRIEVGYGLEGALPDKTAHEIIEYILKPNFRQSDFYNGINKATKAIIKAIKGEYKPSDYGVLSSSSENWFFVYFAIIFLSGIIGGAVKKHKNNTVPKVFHSSMLGGFAGAFAIGFSNSLLISAIVFTITSIIIFLTTKKVSYKSYSKTHPSYDGGIGGGFGSSSSGGFGGGGGGFGGGGASGGW